MEQSQINFIKEQSKKAEESIKPVTTNYKSYNSKTKKMETRKRIIKSGKEGKLFKRIWISISILIFEVASLAILYTQFIMGFLGVMLKCTSMPNTIKFLLLN